jgi:hypothetical protein
MVPRKRRQIDTVINQIGAAWLSARWVALIRKTQREVAELLAELDPISGGNIFEELIDAVERKQPNEVHAHLDEIYHLTNGKLSKAREKLLDLRAIVAGVPEVYGGNGNDE